MRHNPPHAHCVYQYRKRKSIMGCLLEFFFQLFYRRNCNIGYVSLFKTFIVINSFSGSIRKSQSQNKKYHNNNIGAGSFIFIFRHSLSAVGRSDFQHYRKVYDYNPSFNYHIAINNRNNLYHNKEQTQIAFRPRKAIFSFPLDPTPNLCYNYPINQSEVHQ